MSKEPKDTSRRIAGAGHRSNRSVVLRPDYGSQRRLFPRSSVPAARRPLDFTMTEKGAKHETEESRESAAGRPRHRAERLTAPGRSGVAGAARLVPEELLRLAEQLARVRLRLAQLARFIDLDETTAEWEQMVESEIPPPVAFLLSADLDELGGHLEDVERFLRETAFIPTAGRQRTIPEIQAELRLLAPEVSSVKLALQALWREIELSRGESSPVRDLARSLASGYTEGSFSKADSLDEAEESLREDSLITDEDLAREFRKEQRRVDDRTSGP